MNVNVLLWWMATQIFYILMTAHLSLKLFFPLCYYLSFSKGPFFFLAFIYLYGLWMTNEYVVLLSATEKNGIWCFSQALLTRYHNCILHVDSISFKIMLCPLVLPTFHRLVYVYPSTPINIICNKQEKKSLS